MEGHELQNNSSVVVPWEVKPSWHRKLSLSGEEDATRQKKAKQKKPYTLRGNTFRPPIISGFFVCLCFFGIDGNFVACTLPFTSGVLVEF